MLNIDTVDKVYLACGVTDLRRNIDGLTLIVQTQHELRWILKGYEVRTASKFKTIEEKNCY